MSKSTGNGRSRSKRTHPSSVDPGSREACRAPLLEAAGGIRIGIFGFDGVTALDLVGPADVFSIANEGSQALHGGPPRYEVTLQA